MRFVAIYKTSHMKIRFVSSDNVIKEFQADVWRYCHSRDQLSVVSSYLYNTPVNVRYTYILISVRATHAARRHTFCPTSHDEAKSVLTGFKQKWAGHASQRIDVDYRRPDVPVGSCPMNGQRLRDCWYKNVQPKAITGSRVAASYLDTCLYSLPAQDQTLRTHFSCVK
ncbi:hypothetical protein J6590_053150 [Homalodisca vitripennis]|nr:hypothetical protein J6590_053150 [Homalodisca vitripennis]